MCDDVSEALDRAPVRGILPEPNRDATPYYKGGNFSGDPPGGPSLSTIRYDRYIRAESRVSPARRRIDLPAPAGGARRGGPAVNTVPVDLCGDTTRRRRLSPAQSDRGRDRPHLERALRPAERPPLRTSFSLIFCKLSAGGRPWEHADIVENRPAFWRNRTPDAGIGTTLLKANYPNFFRGS